MGKGTSADGLHPKSQSIHIGDCGHRCRRWVGRSHLGRPDAGAECCVAGRRGPLCRWSAGAASYDDGVPAKLERAALERLDATALRSVVATFRDLLRAHSPTINRLNVYPVPDGDTGTNMSRTLDAVVEAVDGAAPDLAATCGAISHGSLMGARGNSGVILSQILRGLASTFHDVGEGGATAVDVAAGLQAASDKAYEAVLKPMEGTILTVTREAAGAAVVSAAEGGSLTAVLGAARAVGREALARTPDLLPVLKEAGVVDAGGAGFLLLFDAALHVVAGEPLPEPDPSTGDVADEHRPPAHHEVGDTRYEVMYLLDLMDGRIDDFKQAWGAIGDSIVVVGGDGLWNCHVHTNDIGAVIEAALGLDGRPRAIRVTDLFEEIALLDGEAHARREVAMGKASSAAGLPPVECAIVAVSSGDGLSELFGQLGVQGVVTGGQTLNPSTAELLAAVEAVNAQQVVVLPNNKNIIAVAEQLDALTTKTVVVVPTRSMPEALAALAVYDPEASAAHNGDEMGGAAATVVTGEVTQAVRDTGTPVGPVRAGDWIGVVRGDGIVAIAPSAVQAATALLRELTEAGELVTIVTGRDATPEQTTIITAWLGEHAPDHDVEVHRGGQPLYPYLFGVE